MWSGLTSVLVLFNHDPPVSRQMSYAETTLAGLVDLNLEASCCEAVMLTATPPCRASRRFTARLSIPFFFFFPLLAGWLVDVTGSYAAMFFLSGGAMLASALTLAIIVGIRHCRRVKLSKEAKHQADP